MTRLPEITSRDELPEESREIFDYIEKTRGGVHLPYSVFLHLPELAYRKLHVGSYVRFETTLPRNVSELAICTAAREFDCRFEWAAHVPQAKNAGVSDNVIAAIESKGDVAGLNDKAAMVIKYVRQVLQDHRVDDATWSAVNAAFGKEGALELTMTAGYSGMLASFLNVLQIEPAADAVQLAGTHPEG
jgi:4-carboxymuconolactone decarboxylase